MPLVLRVVRSMGCFASTPKPTQGTHFNGQFFYGVVAKFHQTQMVTPLVEICDFATNEFATSCDYLTFTTTVGYIYNYYLHLKPLATTLRLTYD